MPNFTTAYGEPDSVGGDNATNDTIVSLINKGFGVVNYRGHGVVEGWQHEWNNLNICFDSAEIIKLKNRNKETIIFSIACSTADINNNNSFIYKLLHSDVAAVAVIGATLPTYTDANDSYDKNLYKVTF